MPEVCLSNVVLSLAHTGPATTHLCLSLRVLSVRLSDFCLYVSFRVLVHHDHAAPFGITAEYAHPVETLVLGLGTVGAPFFFSRHLLTLWIWLSVRLMETVEDHSGYEVPWNPTKLIPFWGGEKRKSTDMEREIKK